MDNLDPKYIVKKSRTENGITYIEDVELLEVSLMDNAKKEILKAIEPLFSPLNNLILRLFKAFPKLEPILDRINPILRVIFWVLLILFAFIIFIATLIKI